ncbi:MAG: hypothetical protein KJ676_06275 [Alphaproteobacteria bacterium]|nr:hypothetical protein [Alphaproteobacteria bacterium]MBU1525033.1 hypothetical protein [Alphaproteobacteria bacterium]MBU2351262.1 hypothetical protein [Alphaproteobacteria bacterium]MBU2382621.1 hypothetical protein [Alphaproteobacteria bacterium]
MSCGLALAVALSLTDPAVATAAAQPAWQAGDPVTVAEEPLFVDIVARAGKLKTTAEGWAAMDLAAVLGGPDWAGFKTDALALADRDMQGHLVLKERGVDGDLKCILRGISEDIPVRLTAFESAASPEERASALSELVHLFDDNVAVITAPPQPEV